MSGISVLKQKVRFISFMVSLRSNRSAVLSTNRSSFYHSVAFIKPRSNYSTMLRCAKRWEQREDYRAFLKFRPRSKSILSLSSLSPGLTKPHKDMLKVYEVRISKRANSIRGTRLCAAACSFLNAHFAVSSAPTCFLIGRLFYIIHLILLIRRKLCSNPYLIVV